MFVEIDGHAYNLNNMTSAEWDEVELWIDVHFIGYGQYTVTGQNALILIDAIRNRAKADEFHLNSSLQALSYTDQFKKRQDNN